MDVRLCGAGNYALFSLLTTFQYFLPHTIHQWALYSTVVTWQITSSPKCIKRENIPIQKQRNGKIHERTVCVRVCGGGGGGGGGGRLKQVKNIFHVEYFESRSFSFFFFFFAFFFMCGGRIRGEGYSWRACAAPLFKRQPSSAVSQTLLMTGCVCMCGSPHVCLPHTTSLDALLPPHPLHPPPPHQEGFNVSFLLD